MTRRPAFRWQRHALLPAALFAVLFTALRTTDADHRVVSRFFDPVGRTFPHRHGLWTETIVHRRGRDLVAAWGVAALLGVGLGSLRLRRGGGAGWADRRRVCAYLAASLLLGSGLVASLKRLSDVDCPWNLQAFGGDRPYFGLLDRRPPELPPGRCFPGGHSSGAFSLFGSYFALREHRPRLAWVALGAVLALGTVFALGQWARGAHFPSHDLTSAWLCWEVALLLYLGPFQGRLLRHRPSAAVRA